MRDKNGNFLTLLEPTEAPRTWKFEILLEMSMAHVIGITSVLSTFWITRSAITTFDRIYPFNMLISGVTSHIFVDQLINNLLSCSNVTASDPKPMATKRYCYGD